MPERRWRAERREQGQCLHRRDLHARFDRASGVLDLALDGFQGQ